MPKTEPKLTSIALSAPIGERSGAVLLGEVTDIPQEGFLIVRSEDAQVRARVTLTVGRITPEVLLGREVLLLRSGDTWVAVDVIEPLDAVARELLAEQQTEAPDLSDTPERLVLSAQQHLELRVGKSSIVINDEGKITTRAERLLQWAKGAIRIKGGHVDIN